MTPISDLPSLLKSLSPELSDPVYAYAQVGDGSEIRDIAPIVVVLEEEGLCVIADRRVLEDMGLNYTYPCRKISLKVHSALEAVGLTAAVSTALTEAGISANIVAGLHHDHLFVAETEAEQAMEVLQTLSAMQTG